MDLAQPILEGIIVLAKQYDIQKVILFGSRARGDNWERSDIDLDVCGGDVTRFSLDVDAGHPDTAHVRCRRFR